MYRRTQEVASDEIPLSPTVADPDDAEDDHGYTPSHEPSPHSPEISKPPQKLPSKLHDLTHRRPHAHDRHVMFLILTIMSIFFLVLNVIQIGLIFEIRNYYWTAVLPAVIFAVFILYFGFEAYRRRAGLQESWHEADWETRIARVGIVATVFLNIIACEFGYLNGEAISVAEDKIWRMTMSSHESLPAPAMALAQDTFFPGRGIIASSTEFLDELERKHTGPDADLPNQGSFNNFTTRVLDIPDMPGAKLNYVTFDGSYHNMNHNDDLDLFYGYYFDVRVPTPALGFMVFDRKFLASKNLFHKALDCGVIVGNLFNPVGRTQLSLEQININDKVKAIDYREGCNDPEFRNYLTYRFTISNYATDPLGSGCGIEGNVPPEDPTDPIPCQGDIDIRFSTMLVTNQTSAYRKNWISMLTDEGGIVGGIMFITWFMGILNQ